MPTAQVLQEYTRDDIRREVLIWANRDLSIPQFYEWLPYCLIPKPKPLYTKRDAAKFVFVANYLNRVRNLEIAKQKLIEDLELNPWRYTQ